MLETIKRNKGFTLIEVLLAVAILSVVVSICVPAVGQLISEGKVAQAQAHSRVLESAKDAYKLTHPFATGTVTALDLAPYMPNGYATTDKTPWNTAFSNTLDLDNPVSFTYEGKTYYANKND